MKENLGLRKCQKTIVASSWAIISGLLIGYSYHLVWNILLLSTYSLFLHKYRYVVVPSVMRGVRYLTNVLKVVAMGVSVTQHQSPFLSKELQSESILFSMSFNSTCGNSPHVSHQISSASNLVGSIWIIEHLKWLPRII